MWCLFFLLQSFAVDGTVECYHGSRAGLAPTSPQTAYTCTYAAARLHSRPGDQVVANSTTSSGKPANAPFSQWLGGASPAEGHHVVQYSGMEVPALQTDGEVNGYLLPRLWAALAGRSRIDGQTCELSAKLRLPAAQSEITTKVARRPQGLQGGGKGKSKWAEHDPAHYSVMPWQPPPPPPAVLEARTVPDGDPGMQELLTALRTNMMTNTLPPAVAEALAKVDMNEGRMVTKTIHSQTNVMGAAQKQLHAVKAARKQQEAAWVDFMQKTIDALEKGAQKFQETMTKYDEQEADATQKLALARKSIRDLATDAAETATKEEEAEEIDDSDLELMDTTSVPTTGVPEEVKVQQVQKKLRITLDALMARLPANEDGTPKRRGRTAPGPSDLQAGQQSSTTPTPAQKPVPGKASAPAP